MVQQLGQVLVGLAGQEQSTLGPRVHESREVLEFAQGGPHCGAREGRADGDEFVAGAVVVGEQLGECSCRPHGQVGGVHCAQIPGVGGEESGCGALRGARVREENRRGFRAHL